MLISSSVIGQNLQLFAYNYPEGKYNVIENIMANNKKYTKFFDADLEVKTFRWPYWLLPLLFISLLLVLGLFIYITVQSSENFGCFFQCQKIDNGGVVPPDFGHLNGENGTDVPTEHEEREVKGTEEPHSPVELPKNSHKDEKPRMVVSGKLIFPRTSNASAAIKNNSSLYVTVSLEDTGIMDMASTLLGRQEFKVDSLGPNLELEYEIKCKKPNGRGSFYSVSAYVNVGWKKYGDNWIRKGDFMTDTNFNLDMKPKKNLYKLDITLVKY